MDAKSIDKAWRGRKECESCGVRDLVLFADLQDEDFRLIHEPIDDLHYAAGGSMYQLGDPGDHVFTIRKGLVKLEQILPDGTVRIVRILKQGDIAGLEALVGESYQQDAVALEPVDACRIPANAVNRLSEQTPRLHNQLMKRWQSAVSGADQWLADLLSGSSKLRVIKLLSYMAELSDNNEIYLPSREDMGSILSVTTETASRVIADLRRKGILTTQGANGAKIDCAALRALRDELADDT